MGATHLQDTSFSDLIALALADVRSDEANPPLGHVVELHNRPNDETVATALRLTRSADTAERGLGLLVLGELGPYDDDGRCPYSDVSIPRLLDMLSECTS